VRVCCCGVQVLDLGNVNATLVHASHDAYLATLILPRTFEGELDISYAISLRSLTVGGSSRRAWYADMQPTQVRCLGVRSPFSGDASGLLSLARVLGELVAADGRPGGPLLPC
jgi:hypothetical protein